MQKDMLTASLIAAPVTFAGAGVDRADMLHIYREDDDPESAPLTSDQQRALEQRMIEAIGQEFRDANGGDLAKPLCVGCTATLFINMAVHVAHNLGDLTGSKFLGALSEGLAEKEAILGWRAFLSDPQGFVSNE